MKKCLLFFSTIVFLCAVSSVQQASAQNEPHWLWVPYAVNQDGYWTGLHIVGFFHAEEVAMYVAGPSHWIGPYTVPLSSMVRWTGYPQDLLPNPNDFKSGSLMVFSSVHGPFSVTQFVGHSNGGFGFQTFHSAPGTGLAGWPNK